ncbi:MAG: putative baseplate assembly protein [Candidatus Electrothrix communis]|nr:MAG: putative baseplate assembly protein [Candidatus Electrothrix communis]
MPLHSPILDNRSYEQLRDELIRRIPVYAPEWTDHNPSDPGITLLELFSFLGENILYRFNQIPDATYLEFLRLLQIPLRPAQPSRTLAVLSAKEVKEVQKGIEAKAGEISFETLTEAQVLPVTCQAVAKKLTEPPDEGSEEDVFFQEAKTLLELEKEAAVPYTSELVPVDAPGEPVDFDATVDNILWVAILAQDGESVEAVRQRLAGQDKAPLLLNIGFIPEHRLDPDEYLDSPAFPDRFRCPGVERTNDFPAVQWTVSTGEIDNNNPQYRPLTVEHDTTEGLSREGVVRLRLPRDLAKMGDFSLDEPYRIGTGDLPPILDDEKLEDRVIFWLRAFHLVQAEEKKQKKQIQFKANGFGKILYVGANAVELEQACQTNKPEFLGTGTGQPHQEYSLVHKYALSRSLNLEVEEADGWRAWTEIDGFHASQEHDRHYLLDPEAGRVCFGNGLQGMAPQIGQRIRLLNYRYGGGSRGNVPPGAVSKLTGIAGVKINNPLAASGGADAESIESALDRIPGELRRRDRAVTQGDFQELALMTPGANIGRAECLPLYHPQRPGVPSPGTISVFIWPEQDAVHPNAPLPDKNQLRAVCGWLDARRLVTTEVYVLPPKYRRIAVAVGLLVKPGYGVDAVRHWVEKVLRQFLSPLPPFGPEGQGWPLGHRVHGPELEAAALQVEGVDYLEDLKVTGWDKNNERTDHADRTVVLEADEVVELLSITVEIGAVTVDPGQALQPASSDKVTVPIPVLRAAC